MRNSFILAAAFLVGCPTFVLAQTDPDWSRREMDRMRAEQERFEAQFERQRAEQERFNAQAEREAARAARQRAEKERRTAREGASPTYTTSEATRSTVDDSDGQWAPVNFERLLAIFDVAKDVCRDGQDQAFDSAISLLSSDEGALLSTYCLMYIEGARASERAAPAKRPPSGR